MTEKQAGALFIASTFVLLIAMTILFQVPVAVAAKSHNGALQKSTKAAISTLEPDTATLIPKATQTPTPSPTPIVNQYDYLGISFDRKKTVNLTFFFPEEEIEVEFVPITYESTGGIYCKYFPALAENYSCIYARDGQVSIGAHSGCLNDKPLTVEALRAVFDGSKICGYPKGGSTELERYFGTRALLEQEDIQVEMEVVNIVWVPPEEIEDFSKTMRLKSIIENLGLEFTDEKRFIGLIFSGRGKSTIFSPSFSAARYLIILQPE